MEFGLNRVFCRIDYAVPNTIIQVTQLSVISCTHTQYDTNILYIDFYHIFASIADGQLQE